MTPLVRGTLCSSQLFPLLLLTAFGFLIFSGLTSVEMESSRLLVVHGLCEIASIVLGFIIFFIIWQGKAYQNPRTTIVSLVTLSNAILELVHILTFPGMLNFATANIDHAWVTAWVFSRLIWSFGMLYVVSLMASDSDGPYFLSSQGMFYATLIAIGGLVTNIVLNYNFWPALHISSYNDPLAVYSQYAALLADIVATIIVCRYCPTHAGKLAKLAIVFAVLADASFALSPHNSYTLNVAGHFFKLLSQFYLLRALYNIVIRQPFDEVIKLKEETETLARNNAKLYEESEEQRNLMEDVLAKIGMIISTQLDLKDTLSGIADMVADVMRTRQSTIALLTREGTLQVVATYGINAPPDLIPLDCSIAGKVCETNTAHFLDDLSLHPDIYRPQLIFTSIRSIVCAPLINDKEILGIIEAYSSEKNAFTNRDALLLRALGYHAGAAITSAKLHEETKIRLSEEQFLLQIAQASASTIDIDTIMEQCTALVAEALNADTAVGFLVTDQAKCLLTCKAIIGLASKPPSFEPGNMPELATRIQSLTPSVCSASVFQPIEDGYAENPGGQIMLMPLPLNNRLLGLIILGWGRFVNQERMHRTTFAALMAQQIALGLEKAHLYNQVKAMALSDGLTGLANRRNFDMFLNTELRRAATLNRPLSLIMFDLDKFKRYNDTYGHTTGDRLLSQIGKILQETVRNIDFPARYGGEEFSIILPECPNAEAMDLAEAIRQRVEDSFFPDNTGGYTARITASLGVATYDPALTTHPPDNARFIAVADEALYVAKDQGRNRVVNAAVL